jgi:hypothetical protein
MMNGKRRSLPSPRERTAEARAPMSHHQLALRCRLRLQETLAAFGSGLERVWVWWEEERWCQKSTECLCLPPLVVVGRPTGRLCLPAARNRILTASVVRIEPVARATVRQCRRRRRAWGLRGPHPGLDEQDARKGNARRGLACEAAVEGSSGGGVLTAAA